MGAPNTFDNAFECPPPLLTLASAAPPRTAAAPARPRSPQRRVFECVLCVHLVGIYGACWGAFWAQWVGIWGAFCKAFVWLGPRSVSAFG